MFEIRAIKAAAAVHRGIVNLSISTLALREKLANKKLEAQIEFADDLVELAKRTKTKAAETITNARAAHNTRIFAIRSAEHTVHNLRDDLDKLNQD